MDEGINVLSLFDGMSCGRIALERAGIKVKNYYASEIKQHAIKLTKERWPGTIHIGNVLDVYYINGYLYYGDMQCLYVGRIHLIIGGSPCQDFSFLKSWKTKISGYGLDGLKSKLFFQFDRLRKETGADFLLENVKMKKNSELILNMYLGVTGVHINSNKFSAQNRSRIYWTNLNIEPVVDCNIFLEDIIELKEDFDDVKVNRTPSRDKMWYGGKCKNITGLDKASCLSTKMDRWNNAGLIAYKDYCRFLTPLECERLQTIPEGYTKGLSNAQRWDLLGDGWTVDVIVHILKNFNYLDELY